MKWIFIVNSLKSGGAEKQVLLIASELMAVNDSVLILELSRSTHSPRLTPFIEAASRKGVKFLQGIGRFSSWISVAKVASGSFYNRETIVWSWGLKADLAAWPLVLLLRYRWIQSLRCADPHDIERKQYIHAALHPWVSLVVANSFSNVSLVRTKLHASFTGMVIYNAVEGGKHKKPSGSEAPAKFTVALLGNLKIHHKGYDILLNAVELCRAESLPVSFRIAGREDDDGWLGRQIRLRGVSKWVTLEGEVTDPEKFLRGADIFLMTSRYEGTPNALLEALEIGLPCITSTVADIPLLFRDRIDLCLTPLASPSCVLESIKWIIGDWSRAQRMALRGRLVVENRFSRARLKSACGNVLREFSLERGRIV